VNIKLAHFTTVIPSLKYNVMLTRFENSLSANLAQRSTEQNALSRPSWYTLAFCNDARCSLSDKTMNVPVPRRKVEWKIIGALLRHYTRRDPAVTNVMILRIFYWKINITWRGMTFDAGDWEITDIRQRRTIESYQFLFTNKSCEKISCWRIFFKLPISMPQVYKHL